MRFHTSNVRFAGSRHATASDRSSPSPALLAALALTATACGSGEDKAADKPAATGSSRRPGDKLEIPADIADKLKEHGIDVDDVEGRRMEELGQGQVAHVRPRTSSTR